mgnify:CR=1 FL=1
MVTLLRVLMRRLFPAPTTPERRDRNRKVGGFGTAAAERRAQRRRWEGEL